MCLSRQVVVPSPGLPWAIIDVCLATSFGKSLCFQLPAVIDHGITIVISPLLALMNNQVAALEAAHIPVATLNSTRSFTDRSAVIKDLCCGIYYPKQLESDSDVAYSLASGHPHIRLLYITPEYTLTLSFRRCLQIIHAQRELARFVIDEAHCISEWGHDFRRAYSRLSYLRAAYPSIPIMCLTATATPSVRTSIISNLCLDPTKLRFFCTTMSRPNLHYEVRFNSDASDTRFHQLVTWLAEIHRRRANDPARKLELTTTSSRLTAFSGIIYVPLRSDCDALASRLRLHNIGAAPYHAGLSALDRTNCEQKWIANAPGYDVIVATTAFGMGIDKQDVRFVVHWSIPKSFESYYQEAGRAGRDGKAAICVLFYSREERDRVAWRVGKDCGCVIDVGTSHIGPGQPSCRGTRVESRAQSFEKLISYCETVDKCRHLLISEFFADKEMPICDYACDFCKDSKALIYRKMAGLERKDHISSQHEYPELLRQGSELNSALFPSSDPSCLTKELL